MRVDPPRVAAVIVLATTTLHCAVNLDSESTATPAPKSSAPVLSSCLPASDRFDALEGRLGAVSLPDATLLFVAENASLDGVASAATGFRNGDVTACLTGADVLARPLIDASALTAELGADVVAQPLAGVTTDSAYLFFVAERELESEGIGIARWDDAAERFVAAGMLWTADRPSYGSAAVTDGGYVYVFGGLAARYLAADAYVARVPLASVTEPAAYEYWAGGGAFSPNADEAAPLVEAGTSPSVAYDAAHHRWLLAYATPLAGEITVRSGLGVTGPWSLPLALGRCDLPKIDAASFCGAVTLLPALANGEELALTQAVATFARAPNAAPADYFTRLLTASWPSALP